MLDYTTLIDKNFRHIKYFLNVKAIERFFMECKMRMVSEGAEQGSIAQLKFSKNYKLYTIKNKVKNKKVKRVSQIACVRKELARIILIDVRMANLDAKFMRVRVLHPQFLGPDTQ